MPRATLLAVTVLVALLALPPAGHTRAARVGTSLTVAASGDFLIHRPVFKRALAYGRGRRYDFRPMFRVIKPFISRADLALCHLETPLSRRAPRGYPLFRAPLGLATAIRSTGWDACSTASNHTLDSGQGGVNHTLNTLDRFGIRHAGSHRSPAGARRITMLRAKGVDVAFLAYTTFSNGQRIPHPWTLNVTRSAAKILGDARRARRAGAEAVIVNLHWGTEYRSTPDRLQRSLAATLTRSRSITAIIGQHVHVVQPIRWINGKPVVFGEGNLLSNQSAGCCPAGARDGLIALLDLHVFRSGVRATRVRYLPTFVRHPDCTILRARGRSRARTIRIAGRSGRVIPLR